MLLSVERKSHFVILESSIINETFRQHNSISLTLCSGCDFSLTSNVLHSLKFCLILKLIYQLQLTFDDCISEGRMQGKVTLKADLSSLKFQPLNAAYYVSKARV